MEITENRVSELEDDRNYSIHEQRKIIEKINKWTEPMGQYQKV